MLCKNPFIRKPTVTRGETKAYEGARLDATPFPCGQCLPCRINQAREWTTRILLESIVYSENVFVGLTYDDEFLPANGELCKKDLQKYLKRVRSRIGKFRYFAIGEYGQPPFLMENGKMSKGYRPHYHIMMFGVSPLLEPELKLAWRFQGVPIGNVDVGECNAYSARYIAGYTTSKVTKYYGGYKGNYLKEIGKKPREFMLSSRQNGGIGTPGIEKIAEQLRRHPGRPIGIIRTIKIGGKEVALGRYLTTKLAKILNINPKEFEKEFWIHQEAIFENFMKGNESYYENIKNFMEPRANRKAKKHLLFYKLRKKKL